MESESPDDRPESPKKKIRPSSTTNSEVSPTDSQNVTGAVGTSSRHYSEMNGYSLAPTRSGRRAEASSSSETNNSNCPRDLPESDASSNEAASIQEEVVSSSENTVHGKKKLPSYSEGDADSLTNEAEDLNGHETERSVLIWDSEAEIKEL